MQPQIKLRGGLKPREKFGREIWHQSFVNALNGGDRGSVNFSGDGETYARKGREKGTREIGRAHV